MRLGLLAALVSWASIAAQQTLVVDPGGGGQFTDLAVALAAAQAGDIVLLRGGGIHAGNYRVAQPITLTADPPRPRIEDLMIIAPPSTSPVTLTRIDVGTILLVTGGRVVAEDVAVRQLDTLQCLGLAMNDCRIGGPAPRAGMGLFGVPLVLTNCIVRGGDAYCDPTTGLPVAGNRALGLTRFGAAEIADCVLIGGAGGNLPCGTAGPGDALVLDLVDPRIGTSTLQGGAGAGSTGNAITITRMVFPPRLDPSVQLVGPVVGQITRVLVPKCAGGGAGPGGAMLCRIDAPAQLPALLLADFGWRGVVARPEGPAWLDVANAVVLAAGSTGAQGSLAAQVVVPTGIRRGLVLTIQGAVWTGTATVTSTPVVVTVL